MKEETKQKIEDVKTNISVWWYGVKWNAKKNFNATVQWCEKHPELAIAMIPVGVTIFRNVGNTARSIDRKIDMKREQDFKDRHVWDYSQGMWHELRRPMTQREKIEYDQRILGGESRVSILTSMGLLK